MKFNAFFKTVFLGLIVWFFVSCDKDFNEIGSDLIDDIHYDFDKEYASVLAYNNPTGPVQTNNMPINTLGFYDNGTVFGTTSASFVTQLEMVTVNPKFYGVLNTNNTPNPNFKIDSVYLHVPYFSKLISTDATSGDSTYELDSIHGRNNKIKLGVYESNYFLRPLDPSTGMQEQRYYSNDRMLVEGVTNVSDFNNRLNKVTGVPHLDQNEQFEFKSSQILFYKTDASGVELTPRVVRERLAPGIYMDLNKEFFYQKIVRAPSGSLVDNNVFKDYFKGLYFKAEQASGSGSQGALARLDFSKGRIIIVYHGKDSETATAYNRKTLTLNMSGITANFIENTGFINPPSNPITGDEKLYLKGGQGSMAVLKLFSGTEIQDIKNSGWLINEANVVFTVDKPSVSSVYASQSTEPDGNLQFEPNRIILYDLNNKKMLVDYSYDTSVNTNNLKQNKYVHDGIMKVDSDKRGVQYKIRLTNHIRNIINKDSTNVTLGLFVSESINDQSNAKLKTSFTAFGKEVKYIPAMSVACPLGTVLWGSNIPSTDTGNYDKRLRLEIFYTKPD